MAVEIAAVLISNYPSFDTIRKPEGKAKGSGYASDHKPI